MDHDLMGAFAVGVMTEMKRVAPRELGPDVVMVVVISSPKGLSSIASTGVPAEHLGPLLHAIADGQMIDPNRVGRRTDMPISTDPASIVSPKPEVDDTSAAHVAGSDTAGLLDLIHRIRVAAGDPHGRLMQTELVDHIAGLDKMVARLVDLMKRSDADEFEPGQEPVSSAEWFDAIEAAEKAIATTGRG